MIKFRTCPNCKQHYSYFKHLKTTSYLYYSQFSCDSCYKELKVNRFSIILRFIILMVSIVLYMEAYDFFSFLLSRIPFTIIYFLFVGWIVSVGDIYSLNEYKRKRKHRKRSQNDSTINEMAQKS